MSRPYVTGKDLIENGVKPDENFSRLLEFAHKLRLAGVSKEDALKQTLSLVKRKDIIDRTVK
jgi:tRNA nucleotidyltransferase (CCA-adding enzyme)